MSRYPTTKELEDFRGSLPVGREPHGPLPFSHFNGWMADHPPLPHELRDGIGHRCVKFPLQGIAPCDGIVGRREAAVARTRAYVLVYGTLDSIGFTDDSRAAAEAFVPGWLALNGRSPR